MGEPNQQQSQVIRPNQLVGWAAAVVAVAVSGAGMAFVEFPVGEPFRSIFWIAFMLLFLEELWRYDLRPRLIWNTGGLVLVDRKGVHRHSWADIKTLSVRSNKIAVRTATGVLQTRFDRPWWLARTRSATRDLPQTIEERLRAAQDTGLAGSQEQPPAAPRAGRPAALYLLAGVGVLVIIGIGLLS